MTTTDIRALLNLGLKTDEELHPDFPGNGSGDARVVKSERCKQPFASAANNGVATRPFESDSPQPSPVYLGEILADLTRRFSRVN